MSLCVCLCIICTHNATDVAYYYVRTHITFVHLCKLVCVAATDSKERPQLRNSKPLPFPQKPHPLAWRAGPAGDGWAEHCEVTCPQADRAPSPPTLPHSRHQ